MPHWWGKSSKEEKKKSNTGSIIGSLHRRCIWPRSPRRQYNDATSEKGSESRVDSQCPSSSKERSSCQSCGERTWAQPLPFQDGHIPDIIHADSGSSARASTKASLHQSSKTSLLMLLPEPGHIKIGQSCAVVGEGDLAAASNFGDSSRNTDDPCDSFLLRPQASNWVGINLDTPTPSGLKQDDQSPVANNKNSRDTLKPAYILPNHQTSPLSLMQEPEKFKLTHLQVPCQGSFPSAPDSSLASISRSPVRLFGHKLASNGDTSCQLFWQNSMCSPEGSPLPSPKNRSPGPGSRIHSGAVTPLYPLSVGSSTESPTSWPDDGKQQCYPLPLPPTVVSNHSPLSPSYSSITSPRVPHSPGRTDNPPSPGSCWKKGRLLGRGTFGQVYVGFNSASGEMCAMKEVTLYSDDAKSRESVQQLGQEIALLSRLCHPNIVQYYGSDMVDDKLYIYLEYVSGGSIRKILQEYGQLGEAAIRSYTQQILSGLAYLHSKSTIHRDIKGANILVDPNGRVKLADFGLAKHVAGEFCPLSFKGSPYWMAPEVIKNFGGCTLALDIWSLGCTVLEMATTKPPWSQYEGVAAIFKIGNSKELPEIPDHLSDEGRDFVKQCLQRNPCRRPTAAQLLEHPFVKNSNSIERHLAEPRESMPAVTHAVKMLGVERCTAPFQEYPGNVNHSKSPKTVLGFRDPFVPRNISCPVSPIGSPLSRSPQHIYGRLSPSPISSPKSTSGPSTPTNGTPPEYHPMATNYWHQGAGIALESQKIFHLTTSPTHSEESFKLIHPSKHFHRNIGQNAPFSDIKNSN